MYRSLKDKKTDLYVTFHFIQNVQHTHCQKVPFFKWKNKSMTRND